MKRNHNAVEYKRYSYYQSAIIILSFCLSFVFADDIDITQNTNLTRINNNGHAVHGIIDNSNVSTDRLFITGNAILATQGDDSYGLYGEVRNLLSEGALSIINTGQIMTQGLRSHGIVSDHQGVGDATVTNYAGLLTQGNGSMGIKVDANSDITVLNHGSIITEHDGASAIFATLSNAIATQNENVVVENRGHISTGKGTTGSGSLGILVTNNGLGDIVVRNLVGSDPTVNYGIYTTGMGAHGIQAYQSGGSLYGDNLILNTSTIHTKGDYAYGISSNSDAGQIIENTGHIITEGANSLGIYAGNYMGSSDIVIKNSGNVTLGTEYTGNVAPASAAIFAHHQGTADLYINHLVDTGNAQGGNIITYHNIAYGIAAAHSGQGNIYINNYASIKTEGEQASGIYLYPIGGNHVVTVNHAGNISAKRGTGITVDELVVGGTASNNQLKINLLSGSSITAVNGMDLVLLGNNTINIDNNASVHSEAVAFNLLRKNSTNSQMVINNAGILTSSQDKLLTTQVDASVIGTSDLDLTFNNMGSMAGYFEMDPSGIIKLTNSGLWTVQNRLAPTAIVSFTSSNNNQLINHGTMAFANGKTEINGVPYFDNRGILDLTKHAGVGTEVAIGLDQTNSNFIANGGAIMFNAILDPQQSQGGVSDRLLLQNTVLGSASTNIFVQVNPALSRISTSSSSEDRRMLEVINVVGNSANNVFALGHDLFAGAYQYQLEQAGNNWYLTNYSKDGGTLIIRPDVGLDLAPRQAITDFMTPGLDGNGIAANGVGGSGAMRSSLRLNDISSQKSNSVWAFSTGLKSKGRASGQIHYDTNSATLQIGADKGFVIGDGFLQAGVMTYLNTAKSHSVNIISGTKVKGEMEGYGFGVYGTWFFKADSILSPYIDLYALFGRYKHTNKTLNNPNTSYKSNAYSISVIGGYPIALSENIILEPQAQLTYVKYQANHYIDSNATEVSMSAKGNTIGRIGSYLFMNNDIAFKPYLAMNLWYDGNTPTVRYRSITNPQVTTKVSANKRGLIYEGKLGFQSTPTNNFSFWGEVQGKVGRNHYKDYGIAAGIKYQW